MTQLAHQSCDVELPAAPAAWQRLAASQLSPTICLLGGATDTGNLGVSALGVSAVKGIKMVWPRARIMLHRWRREPFETIELADGGVEVESIFLHRSKQWRQRYGLKHLHSVAPLFRSLPGPVARGLARYDRTLEQLLRADVVMDISAGDSFADIYGERVFNVQSSTKLLVKKLGKPLILLPQTYGPFDRATSIATMQEIVGYADLVATRESAGIDELEQMCGGVRPQRVACCPDMAFLLDPLSSAADQEPFLTDRDHRAALIGLNVSGLLYKEGNQHGLDHSYEQLIDALIEWAMSKSGAHLLLVPHVVARKPLPKDKSQWSRGRDMSDTAACQLVCHKLRDHHGDRVHVLGGPYTASQTKYFIGQCDFFIGARMHSCIGAVSQAVPTATLAYSKKALGLMQQLGIGDTVVDLRTGSLAECVSKVESMFVRREEIHEILQSAVPQFRASVERFFFCDVRGVVEGLATVTRKRICES